MTEDATIDNRLFSLLRLYRPKKKKGRGADVRIYNQRARIVGNRPYWNGNSTFGTNGRLGKGCEGTHEHLFRTGREGIVAPISALSTCSPAWKAWGGAFDVGSVTQYGRGHRHGGSIFELTAQFGTLKTNADYLDATFQFLDIPNSMYQGSLTTEKRADRQYEWNSATCPSATPAGRWIGR